MNFTFSLGSHYTFSHGYMTHPKIKNIEIWNTFGSAFWVNNAQLELYTTANVTMQWLSEQSYLK